MSPGGAQVLRTFILDEREEVMTGKVHHSKKSSWRVRHPDGTEGELTKMEKELYGKQL